MPQKIEQPPLEPAASEEFAEAEYEEEVALLEPEHPDRRDSRPFLRQTGRGGPLRRLRKNCRPCMPPVDRCADQMLNSWLICSTAALQELYFHIGWDSRNEAGAGRGTRFKATSRHPGMPSPVATSLKLRRRCASSMLLEELTWRPWRVCLAMILRSMRTSLGDWCCRTRDRESRRPGAQRHVSARRH